MVRSRLRSSAPGASATACRPAPRRPHSTKGIVKMPARLVPTVRSTASAALPPTACTNHLENSQEITVKFCMLYMLQFWENRSRVCPADFVVA